MLNVKCSFVTHNFCATEVCGNAIIPAHNYFSLSHHTLATSPKKSFLKTIRYEYTNTPTYFSKSKDKYVLHLAAHCIYPAKTRYNIQMSDIHNFRHQK